MYPYVIHFRAVAERAVIPPEERDRLHAAARQYQEATEHSDRARDYLVQAVKDAKSAGGSVRVIAAEIGVAPRTVTVWLAK